MMPALRVAQKELRDIVREKSIVVALLVQFFIAAFSAFLAVGLLALYDPGSLHAQARGQVAYVGPDDGDHFDSFIQTRYDRFGGLGLAHVDAAAALAGFHAGRYQAVVQESAAGNATRTITLLLPDGQLQSTLLVTQLKGWLQDYESAIRIERQERIGLQVQSVVVGDAAQQELPYPFLYSTLIPLLFLTPVFLSGAIAADSLAGELQSRTLTILRSAPASLRSILAGKLLVPLLLAPAQFLLWAGLLQLNHVPVHNLGWLCLASLLLTATLAGTGFALAARLRRDGPTQASYALAALAQAGLSLLLPRDPLNLVAVVATGRIDGASWLSFAILGAVAALVLAMGFADAARSIRARPD
ncbi:MAG: ABC transporter permease subunit [Thermoplasmatota archaeon]